MNDSTHEVIQTILQNLGMSDAGLIETMKDRLSQVELEQILAQLTLTTLNDRNRFYWLLQVEIENGILQFPSGELTERVAASWNVKQPHTQICPNTVHFFIEQLGLNNPSVQTAFSDMCKGKFEDILRTEHQSLLIDSMVRYASCLNHKYNSSFIEEVHHLLMSMRSDIPYECVIASLNRLDFLKKEGKVNESKMNAYQRIIGPNQLAFMIGFTRFLQNRLQMFMRQDMDRHVISQPEQEIPHNEEGYVKRLEEEMDRLIKSLETEKENTIAAIDKTVVQLLSSIAGKQSNYLLSDIYEESEGHLPDNRNISRGRLINLFSALSLQGIEPYTSGYELHEVIELNKEDLVRNFMLDQPIRTNYGLIKVKVIRYGWQYHGKVVIQPLAVEITEVTL